MIEKHNAIIKAGSEMALSFFFRKCEYLQYICNRKSNIEGCDIQKNRTS